MGRLLLLTSVIALLCAFESSPQRQGAIGDCYYMTLMAAIAKVNPDHARQLVCDLGDGTYAVDFKNNNGTDAYVRVDGDLPTWSDGTLAYARFGKGRHAAGLNFGDVFAYALASTAGEPLLFKGDDFAKTDIGRVI